MNYKMIILAAIIGYCLGNISPSILIGRAMGIDIKKEGSGNAGTTNALRVLGKKAAVITLIIDIGKGSLAVFLGNLIAGPAGGYIAGLFAFAGHIWPAAFNFKGGKGVAVSFGVIMMVNWKLGLLTLLIVVIVVLLTKMVSAGSVTAAICFPVMSYFMEPGFVYYGVIIALLVIFAHRSNISRIIKGEENKLSFKK